MGRFSWSQAAPPASGALRAAAAFPQSPLLVHRVPARSRLAPSLGLLFPRDAHVRGTRSD